MTASLRPRVLMVGPDPEVMGGISTVAKYYLASDLVNRVDLLYISSHRDGSKPFKLKVAVEGFARYWHEMLLRRPALVHIHLSDDASFFRKAGFFFAAKSLGIPALFHLHGPRFHLFAARSAGHARAVRAALDRADRILVLSHNWNERLAPLTSNRKIHVLYNPTSLGPFPQDPPERGAQDPCHLVFMGLLGERKGLDVLKTALETLMPRHPQLEATLAGNGAVDETRAWAARFPWGTRIHVPGWVRGDDKWRAFRKAHIFTLPSYDEGLPMSVLEGMAAGCALVTTPVGGIPEAVTHGKEGFLVPAGDAPALAEHIGRLVADPALCRQMGLAGRQTVRERFDIGAHVDQLVGHYQAVLGA